MDDAKFLDRIAYVKHVLAGATDAQLKFFKLTNEERDAVVEKDVRLVGSLPAGADGAFHVRDSYRQNETYISYCPDLDDNRGSEVAAHELYHAAKFWPQSKKRMANSRALFASAGIITPIVLAGSLLFSPPLAYTLALGLNVLNLGMMIKQSRSAQKEDLAAQRFGRLFNLDSYYKSPDDIEAGPETLFQKTKKAIFGYPTKKHIAEIQEETAQECTQLKYDQKYAHGFFYANWRLEKAGIL